MIKKLIGTILRIPEQGPSLVDCVEYPVNTRDGYSGNSLLEKNILYCVISTSDYSDVIEKQSIKENFNYSILKINDLSDISSVHTVKSKYGPFEKIINIVELESSQYSLFNKDYFNEEDALFIVYRLLQVESDYLIDNKGSSISTAIISNEKNNKVLDRTIENLLVGLGLPLANHRIIVNSLIADTNVNRKNVFETLSFLASKYGYELNGEILRLGNSANK